MILECGDALTDQQAVTIGPDANQSHATVREIEHLRCAGVENKLFDKRTNELLRADAHIDRNRILGKQLVGIHILSRANACDFCGRTKLGVGDLAGHHVGFVRVGQRDDDVGIAGTGSFEDFRIGGVSYDRAYVEPVLKLTKNLGPLVDNGDLVGLFSRQVIGRGRTHLTCAED